MRAMDQKLEYKLDWPKEGLSKANVSVLVINRLWREDAILRKNHESTWIRTLG